MMATISSCVNDGGSSVARFYPLVFACLTHGFRCSVGFLGNVEGDQLRFEANGPVCSVGDAERHPNHPGDLGGTAQVQPQEQANGESEYRHQEVTQVPLTLAQEIPGERCGIDSHERK